MYCMRILLVYWGKWYGETNVDYGADNEILSANRYHYNVTILNVK